MDYNKLISDHKLCPRCMRKTEGEQNYKHLKKKGIICKTCDKCRTKILKGFNKYNEKNKKLTIKEENEIMKNILKNIDKDTIEKTTFEFKIGKTDDILKMLKGINLKKQTKEEIEKQDKEYDNICKEIEKQEIKEDNKILDNLITEYDENELMKYGLTRDDFNDYIKTIYLII